MPPACHIPGAALATCPGGSTGRAWLLPCAEVWTPSSRQAWPWGLPSGAQGEEKGTDRVRRHLSARKGSDEGMRQGSHHRHAPQLSCQHVAAAIKA